MMMMMMAMMIMVMRMRSLTRQIGRLLYSDNFKRVGFVCHNYICCFVFALCWCFVLITVSLQSYPLFNGHHPSASLTSPSDPNGQWCCTSTISNQLSLKLSMVKHLIFFLFVFSVQFELLILLSWSWSWWKLLSFETSTWAFAISKIILVWNPQILPDTDNNLKNISTYFITSQHYI